MRLSWKANSDGQALLGLIFLGAVVVPFLTRIMVGGFEAPLVIRVVAAALFAFAVYRLVQHARAFWQMPAADSCRTTAFPLSFAAIVVTLMSVPVLGLLPDGPEFSASEILGGLVTAAVAANLVGLATRDWIRLARRRSRVAA